MSSKKPKEERKEVNYRIILKTVFGQVGAYLREELIIRGNAVGFYSGFMVAKKIERDTDTIYPKLSNDFPK